MVKNEEMALDSNIVIDVLNNKKAIVGSLKNDRKVYWSITVCGELWFGAKNSAKRQITRLIHLVQALSKQTFVNIIGEIYGSQCR